MSNEEQKYSITENLKSREAFAYCRQIYRFFFFFCPSFTLPLFLSCFSRSLHTYINYTIVLRSYTYSVEIHARRLRRQAWSGIEKMIFKPSFLFFFVLFSSVFQDFLPIHSAFVHSRTFSLFLTFHHTTSDIYLHISTYRCLCIRAAKKDTCYFYIHSSRVCFRLKHSVRLAVYYTCSFSPFYLKFSSFYNYIIPIRLHTRACSRIIYASFIRNICICAYM